MSGSERYTIRQQILRIFGAGFFIFDAQGVEVGYCAQKAFKLKEDLRVYTNRSRETELFRMRARSIIDFGTTYDILTPAGDRMGSLRRRGMKSMLRDEWEVLNHEEVKVGTLLEDSGSLALLRRLGDVWSTMLPQSMHLRLDDGTEIARYRTHFNPFVYRLGISVLAEDDEVDDLVILGAGCLFAAIDGRS